MPRKDRSLRFPSKQGRVSSLKYRVPRLAERIAMEVKMARKIKKWKILNSLNLMDKKVKTQRIQMSTNRAMIMMMAAPEALTDYKSPMVSIFHSV